MELNQEDYKYMAMALRLAEQGRYSTHPNPRVGCVIVKDGKVVGRGYHRRAGEGHAEVNALLEAGEAARGATAYVTLEPCAHHGRTGPCALALTEAGIRRVVAAMRDPFVQVSGKGFDHLEEHQIQIDYPIMESSSRALNPGFLKWIDVGLPFVRLKLAMSLDGKIALANGNSQWITGPAARSDVQRLRAMSSAVVTGIDTVLADDPQLNVRADELGLDDADFIAAIPRRKIVLDTGLRMPPDARIISTELTVITGVEPGATLPFDCVQLPVEDGRLSLEAVMGYLGQEQLTEVLFECGPTLAGAMLAQGWVDELIVYMAPKLMGAEARSLINFSLLTSMDEVPELNITDVRTVGTDIKITAVPETKRYTDKHRD